MRTLAVSSALLLVWVGCAAAAQTPGTRLTGDVDHPLFGHAVAVVEDRVAVGAPSDVEGIGAVYLFDHDPTSGWSLDTLLEGSIAGSGGTFGHSVALDGSRLIVGAPGSESAFVYVRDPTEGWELEEHLESTDTAPDDGFGTAVTLAGNYLFVGAASGDGAVEVYVFESQTGWSHLQTLSAPDGGAFGTSISASTELAVVGAPLADEARGTAAGLVYVFARGGGTTWTLKAVLQASNAEQDNHFGHAVTLGLEPLSDVPFVMAGAPGAGLNRAGNVYTYVELDGMWTETNRHSPPEAETGDGFGESLAVDGSLAVVGAPGWDDGVGTAWVLARDSEGSWNAEARLRAADEQYGARFGFSAAVEGNHLAVGAPYEDASEPDLGATYMYDRSIVLRTALPALVPQRVHATTFPNPFRTSVTFVITAQASGAPLYLSVYDVQGRRVATLSDGEPLREHHVIEWSAHNRLSGVYFWLLRVGTLRRSGHVTLVR